MKFQLNGYFCDKKNPRLNGPKWTSIILKKQKKGGL